MKFLCLVYGEAAGATRLRPASTATTVRVRNGQTEVVDGPFAESGEHLRGYAVLECADLGEALATARDGFFESGAVEVRPQYAEEPA